MQALTFFFAFVAVLALIGVAAWLVRRFAGNRLGANTNRGRMPRLAVIDAAAVDGRRRLVLVRRDNVEHLLMIGGPTDIVVEPNIVRAMPARDQMPQRAGVGGAEPPPRIAPLPDAGWTDGEGPRSDARSDAFDHAEPQMPEPPPRPVRPSFADEVRRPAPAISERRSDRGDPLAGFTPESLGGRPEPRPELRGEPMPSRVTSRNDPVIPRPPRPTRRNVPPRRRPRLCRQLTKISPRWRNGWRQRFAVPPATPANHGSARRRWRRSRRLPVLPAASHRWRRRLPRLRRAGLKISKTRWRHCWAVQRPLREGRASPA